MKRETFLYQKTVDYLSQLIIDHCGEEGYKLPTEMAVCEELGVSRITVRRAYGVLEEHNLVKRAKRGGTRINDELSREAVLSILHSDRSASEFITKSKTIAVILPIKNIMESYHITSILAAIIDNRTDETLIIDNSSMSLQREQELIEKYVGMCVDGIILYPVDNDIYNPMLLQLSTVKYPLILVDRYLPGLSLPCVSADHDNMVSLAANHLLEAGHKSILYFNANIKTNSSLSMRKESFINTLYSAHNYRPYFYSFEGDSDPTSASFCDEFREFLDANRWISAIITADYSSGLHLSKMLDLLGEPYKSRFEVVYLDFYPAHFETIISDEHPTYIMQDSYEIGREALRLMRSALEGNDTSNAKLIVPATLVPSNRKKHPTL